MYRAIFILSTLLSGCTTALWSPEYKEELVNGFYVNSSTNELFVTTKESAYVFPITRKFEQALLLTRQSDFHPQFKNFSLNEKNIIEGTVTLTLIERSSSNDLKDNLKSLGFEKSSLTNSLQLSNKIVGQRYLIEGDLPLEKFEKDYRVMVAQPATFSETARKIIATPAAITYDAIVVVPAVFIGASIMVLASP